MKRVIKKDTTHHLKNKELHDSQDPELFKMVQKELELIRFLEFPQFKLDVEKLQYDLQQAENKHPFIDKLKKTWKSIPLRSVNGLEGKRGNEGGNLNNSPDPKKYQDTPVMGSCPYIKEIMNNLNVPLLKVRLMSLEPNRLLPEHTDDFNDDRILRIHIPIVTHRDVLFYVDKKSKNLEAGKMCYANVRKMHKVHNKSKIVRVHLVFDIWVTDEFIIDTLNPAIKTYKEHNSVAYLPKTFSAPTMPTKESTTMPQNKKKMVRFKQQN
jgi:Aspartyl/Asparaginyl beta-hydroxylase